MRVLAIVTRHALAVVTGVYWLSLQGCTDYCYKVSTCCHIIIRIRVLAVVTVRVLDAVTRRVLAVFTRAYCLLLQGVYWLSLQGV